MCAPLGYVLRWLKPPWPDPRSLVPPSQPIAPLLALRHHQAVRSAVRLGVVAGGAAAASTTLAIAAARPDTDDLARSITIYGGGGHTARCEYGGRLDWGRKAEQKSQDCFSLRTVDTSKTRTGWSRSPGRVSGDQWSNKGWGVDSEGLLALAENCGKALEAVGFGSVVAWWFAGVFADPHAFPSTLPSCAPRLAL